MYDCRMMRISLSGSTDILVFVSPMLEYKFTCMSVSVCLFVRHTFCQLVYRSDLSTDFYS